jgi:integrase
MRAGAVSAAAMEVQAPGTPPLVPQHCCEALYAHFLETLPVTRAYRLQRLAWRRQFVERWPELHIWVAAPLALRVGRLPGEHRGRLTDRVCYRARHYLLFLALRGFIRLDYAWLLGAGRLHVDTLAQQLGITLGIDDLIADAVRLGFDRGSAIEGMQWCVGRLAVHTGLLTVAQFRMTHLAELLDAIRRFGQHPALPQFYTSPARYRTSPSKHWITQVTQLQTVLFHRGQLPEEPRKQMPTYMVRPPLSRTMQAVVDQWLAIRRLTDRPATVVRLERALRGLSSWLCAHEPGIRSFAEVDREHVLRYLTALAQEPTARTGQPLCLTSRASHISALAMFFRQTAAWDFPDVPGRPLLGPSDMPKRPARLPRFIPDEDLARLMGAITELPCPYQRAALLVARWSGARRSEIRRLALDCLDTYPDGTPRLRLPVGKTRRERMVPLHDEATAALRAVMALRVGRGERPLRDERTGTPTHYLFMEHGKLLSDHYLFAAPLRAVCQRVGLVDAQGRPTITPHRFRHTVGTQLAERGAKLHTIMQILGHQSVSMALVYAQISDPEVLRDYHAVLGPGATLAGPAAEALRSTTIPPSTVEWLKTNFFKTALELGHCLRLPAEGPCECELYWTCAKFVTTPAYAPRLRRRRQVELTLVADAEARGWPREVERHQAIAARLEQLLVELGEPIEGPMADEPLQRHDASRGAQP